MGHHRQRQDPAPTEVVQVMADRAYWDRYEPRDIVEALGRPEARVTRWVKATRREDICGLADHQITAFIAQVSAILESDPEAADYFPEPLL